MKEHKVRPIDANALMDAIGPDAASLLTSFDQDLLDLLLAEIDDAPTLDYAPVVRCKDCVFYDTTTYANPHCASIAGLPRVIDPDNFCSRGIRRSDGE